MGKIKFQMLYNEEQQRTHEMLQRDTKIPIAEITRSAIRWLSADYKRKIKMHAAISVRKSGPRALADVRDKYLYGTKQ